MGRRETDLAKVHGLDTFATKGRTDWGTGTCLTGSDDELHDLVDCRSATCLGHLECAVYIYTSTG